MARTVDDWMYAAGQESSAVGVERVVREAMAHASDANALQTVIAGLDRLAAVPVAILPELAERTLAAGVRERSLWAVRNCAHLRMTRLHDPDGARQALDAGVQMFERSMRELGPSEAWRAVHGYEWVLLGEGFAETLGDRDAQRACLERGREQARANASVDDLIAIGEAWGRAIDRDAGLALLAEAERLATDHPEVAWGLANAFHALGDEVAVRHVLDDALARAATTDAAIHVARAWASHGALEAARVAMACGESFAATADEWLELAETAFDAGLGDDAIRRALAAAEPRAAHDDDLRARIASGYLAWLGDSAAATRIGPRGIRPGTGRPQLCALPGHVASATALFDRLRALASPETLDAIATADYGQGSAKHHAALRDIVETGCVPRVLPWEPHEVLALTRWSEGERIDHVARALSCVILCIAPWDLDDLVDNGPILLDSCLVLGAETTGLAAQFFAWCAETLEDPEQSIALALVLLAYAAASPADPRIGAVTALLDGDVLAEVDFAGAMRGALWGELVAKILPSHPALAVIRASTASCY